RPGITDAIAYFGVDLDALHRALAAAEPAPPLAWNAALARAAEAHSARMIAADSQSHVLPGEDGLLERTTAAGYASARRVSENVYAYPEDPVQGQAGFIIAWGYDAADFGADGALLAD